MKLIIPLLFLPIVAFGQKVETPTAPSRQALLQTVLHIQRLAQDLQSNLDKEKVAHAQTDKALATATSQNVTLQNAINAQSDQLNKAIGERDHILKQLHILKFIVSGAVTAAIVFAFLYFPIPPPFNLYAAGALIVAANAFIWWKL